MEILEVTDAQYAGFFPNPSHVFNAAAFNALNASKCDGVYYLVFKDSKVRLGIILGIRNNKANTPFSAPFGGFEAASPDIRLSQIDAALEALAHWAKAKNLDGIKIVPPPFFYNQNFLHKLDNCLFRAGYDKANIELNYQFPTVKLDADYETTIWYNARKNLKRSMQAGLSFGKLDHANAKEAYDVIAQNRSERGFPLRMTWEQVQATTAIIPADFFLAKKDSETVAAAVVFHVADQVVQVIYWGDLPKFSEHKTMNFLSYSLFKYYSQNGIAMIDIGPSTEDSVPNYGLCEFKESIGCDLNIKTEYFKKL
jgi:hypothetical protein